MNVLASWLPKSTHASPLAFGLEFWLTNFCIQVFIMSDFVSTLSGEIVAHPFISVSTMFGEIGVVGNVDDICFSASSTPPITVFSP